jgi:D-lactate dehydrogenase
VNPTDPAVLRAREEAVPDGIRSRAPDRTAPSHDASHDLLTPEAVVL